MGFRFKKKIFDKQAEFRFTEDINGAEGKETDSKTTAETDNKPTDLSIPEKLNWFTDIHIKQEEGTLVATSEMDCVFCSKTFGSQEKLNKHIKLKHTPKKEAAQPKVFVCSFCAHQCDNKADLKEHMKTHEIPESFLCQHCAIQFNNKEALSHHIKSNHQEILKIQCRYCPYICHKKIQDYQT